MQAQHHAFPTTTPFLSNVDFSCIESLIANTDTRRPLHQMNINVDRCPKIENQEQQIAIYQPPAPPSQTYPIAMRWPNDTNQQNQFAIYQPPAPLFQAYPTVMCWPNQRNQHQQANYYQYPSQTCQIVHRPQQVTFRSHQAPTIQVYLNVMQQPNQIIQQQRSLPFQYPVSPYYQPYYNHFHQVEFSPYYPAAAPTAPYVYYRQNVQYKKNHQPIYVISRRRARVNFSTHQVNVLKKRFAKRNNIGIEEREEFSKTIDLTAEQVKHWFERQRAAERRKGKADHHPRC